MTCPRFGCVEHIDVVGRHYKAVLDEIQLASGIAREHELRLIQEAIQDIITDFNWFLTEQEETFVIMDPVGNRYVEMPIVKAP